MLMTFYFLGNLIGLLQNGFAVLAAMLLSFTLLSHFKFSFVKGESKKAVKPLNNTMVNFSSGDK